MAAERIGRRRQQPSTFLIYIPPLNNNSALKDESFDPLTRRCISPTLTHEAEAEPVINSRAGTGELSRALRATAGEITVRNTNTRGLNPR